MKTAWAICSLAKSQVLRYFAEAGFFKPYSLKPAQLLRWRRPKNQEAFTTVAVDESYEIEQCYSLNCELWPENYGFQFNKANRDPCGKRLYLVIKTDLKTWIKLKFSLYSDQYFKRNRGKKVVQESPKFLRSDKKCDHLERETELGIC